MRWFSALNMITLDSNANTALIFIIDNFKHLFKCSILNRQLSNSLHTGWWGWKSGFIYEISVRLKNTATRMYTRIFWFFWKTYADSIQRIDPTLRRAGHTIESNRFKYSLYISSGIRIHFSQSLDSATTHLQINLFRDDRSIYRYGLGDLDHVIILDLTAFEPVPWLPQFMKTNWKNRYMGEP